MKFTLLGTARINLLFLIKTDLHLVLPLVIASALGIFNFFFFNKDNGTRNLLALSFSSLYDKFKQVRDANLLIIPPIIATEIGW